MGKLLRIFDAAELLGVTGQTLRNWADSGVVKFRKIGHIHYIDESTVKALQGTAKDAEDAYNRLVAQKEAYEHERHIISEDRYTRQQERRYKNLCVEGSIRSQFFGVIIRLLVYCGDLTERDGAVLEDRLKGKSLEDISSRHGITRERCRQIAEKAIRRAGSLIKLKEKLEERQQMLSDIAALKQEVTYLRSQLEHQATPAITPDEHLFKLLSTNIRDCGLSVRTTNCLVYGDRYSVSAYQTLGDVCRSTITDLLKLRNFGRKSLLELEEYLESNGLSFGMDVDSILRGRVDTILSK